MKGISNTIRFGPVRAAALLSLAIGASAGAQWTVVNLTPPGSPYSIALAGHGARQAGEATVGGQDRAVLWSGTAASWVDLTPAGGTFSRVLAVSGGYQAGEATVGGVHSASLWSGTSGSWVNLNPAGSSLSYVNGLDDGQQVGVAYPGGVQKASLWYGTADSWVDLSPPGTINGMVRGVHAGQQAGYLVADGVQLASLWYGTADSWVNLNPPGASYSYLNGTDGFQQAGMAFIGGQERAGVWYGTAESFVDLTPPGATRSDARRIDAGRQVGTAVVAGVDHASLWSGTSDSWVDLHAFVPPQFGHSEAFDIWQHEGATYVVGLGRNNGTGRNEALMWIGPPPESDGPDNTFPVAVCGGAVTAEAQGLDGATVQLDGAGSYDPDGGDTISYHWDVSNLAASLDDLASPTPVGIFPIGITMATLTVSDGRGGVDTCDVVVTVQDTTPPQVQATSDIGMLWPPNGKMRTVKLYIVASDIVGLAAFNTATVTTRSDEPDDAKGNGDGATTGDVNGADGFAAPVNVTGRFAFDPGIGSSGGWVATVQLRAERAGAGDGRCYTVDVAAQDAAGNHVATSCCIVVPHDQGK